MIFHNVAQGSADWYALRRGMPTASCMDQIISSSRSWYVVDADGDNLLDVSRHTRQDTAEKALAARQKKGASGMVASRFEPSGSQDRYISTLLAEWALGSTIETYQSREMERGQDLEPEARAWYEMQTDTQTFDGGFIMNDAATIGCSPDFVVYESLLTSLARDEAPKIIGGGEIKCPTGPVHMDYARGVKAITEKYQHQIQGCLMLTGAQWWDVVSYFPHPGMPPVIQRVVPEQDAEYRSALSSALTVFVAKLEGERERMAALGFGPKDGKQ